MQVEAAGTFDDLMPKPTHKPPNGRIAVANPPANDKRHDVKSWRVKEY
jgi:hypothetical protein